MYLRLAWAAFLLCGVARVALAQGAAADEKTERARVHLKAAIAYYDEGRYEDAAKEMQVAYELKPVADLQYNLAQCYERLNKLEEAATAYENYLAGTPAAPDRKEVTARVGNLRERVKAGAGASTAPPAAVEKVVFKTIVVYKQAPPPPGRAARFAGYALGVLGLGCLATGVAFAVLAKEAADEVSKGGSVSNPPLFDGSIRATQDAGKTYPIISGVTFGVGGLALLGAIGLYLIGNKVDREAPKLSLAPSFGPSGGGLFAAGHF